MLGGKTVCLCMIVKNEAKVIKRCLDSVKPHVDRWLVVDTGSTDGTQDLIKQELEGIPGWLVDRPWVNFAHNRTEALSLTRGKSDYAFILDADEIVEVIGDCPEELTSDAYSIENFHESITYFQKRLVRTDLPWHFVGKIHEVLTCNKIGYSETIPDWIRIIHHHDGSRATDPLKYFSEAIEFEKILIETPTDSRSAFYMAQSYRDAGDSARAINAYKRRIEMGGWQEEVFYSMYQIPKIRYFRGDPWQEVLADYLAAYQYHPDRAEPLYWIGMHYQKKQLYNVSKPFLEYAARIPFPEGNRLFVEHAIYNYLAALEYAVACHWTGDYREAILVNDELLTKDKMPIQLARLVAKNLEFSRNAIG